jgi:predicted regulator of Ras-like GTPase activity (Roadblock/LC7/MglB family)
VDAQQAVVELTEISSQITATVIVDAEGGVLASTFSDDEQARRMAEAAQELLAAAEQTGRNEGPLGQLQAAMLDESVFVVRDGERIIAATTGPEPTIGLVFYDLKRALRSVAAETEEEAKPKPRARRKQPDTEQANAPS